MEIDKLSNSIDALVDEEETYVESLKEYFYFAESLKVLYLDGALNLPSTWVYYPVLFTGGYLR